MSVVCLGSWRTLCTALRKEQPGPSISKWAMIIHRAQLSQLGPSGPPPPSYSQHTIAHSRLGQSQSCARYSASIGNKHFPRPFSSGSQLCNAASKPSKPKGSLTKDKVFSAEKIRSILGTNADAVKGNEMLHLIQEHRLAGTIDKAVPGSRLHKDRALAWLRMNYPVDEEKAILDRLDREDEAAAQPQAWREGQTSVYGDSVIDRWKKENIAKQERRKAEEAEEKARRGAEAKEVPVSGTKAVAERPSPIQVWAQKHRKAVEDSGLQSVPHMSFLQRVGPVTLMTVTILTVCVLFAQHYIPPSRAARLLSDIPPAAATVGGLIAINVTVWLAWKVPSLWRPLTRYFLLCPVYPYVASILGNNFSHQALKHLSVNMVVLWFMGTSCK
ncbi:MAG: hypothetical protein LQ350_007480 [Teloschistes chrysophthalmus]|nr:MAG: hypothetical protein LQ350_007480 [Niorma chrysophthalma]